MNAGEEERRQHAAKQDEAVPTLVLARAFVSAFLHFSGARAAVAAALSILGALVEGLELALLLPVAAFFAAGPDDRAGRWLADAFAALGIETRSQQLAAILLVWVAIVAVRAVILRLRDNRVARLQHGFVEHLRARLATALAEARWQRVAEIRHARITNALGAEAQRVSQAAGGGMQMFTTGVVLIVQWLLALLISPIAGIFILVVMAGALAASLTRLERAGSIGHQVVGRQTRIMDLVHQFLGGLKLAMAENMQRAFVRNFEASTRAMIENQLELSERQSRVRVGVTTIVALLCAAALLGGVWIGASIATLLVLIAIANRMSRPALAFQQAAYQTATLLPAYASLARLMVELERGKTVPTTGAGGDWSGAIAIDTLGFRHPGGARLDDVSLTIERGQVVAITGPSGAGKTTLLDLIAGLLEPDEGEIRIGATPLDPANVAHWRDTIAYVTQDSYLLNTSIRRNLEGGRGAIDEAEIMAALEASDAADLIRSLPEGLETLVGERGLRLSGGERQRIALARALLRKPALLMLDEATNAIDLERETLIWKHLLADGPPTVIVVTHRSETVAHCDRIVTIENGRVTANRAAGADGGR